MNRFWCQYCFVLFCLLPGLACAEGNFTLNGDGLNFSADHGNYTGNLGGRIYYDANFFQNNQLNLVNGSHPSQIYAAGEFTLFNKWQLVSDGNFAQQNKVEDLYFSYIGSSWYSWQVGQFQPLFGLDNSTSSMYSPMVSSPLIAQILEPGYAIGGEFLINSHTFSWASSVIGPQIGVQNKDYSPAAISSRFVYAPINDKGRLLHFGLSLWEQYPDASSILSLQPLPEVVPNTNATIIGTNVTDVKSNFTSDLEFAAVKGPWDIQTEYTFDRTNRFNHQPDPDFNGYYVQLGYFLTGETYEYSFPGGYFTGVSKPRHKYGAWQLLGQISNLDLNSKNVLGGNETNLSAGLNWYLNKNVILKSEVIRVWALLPDTNEHYNNMIYALRLILYV